MDTTLAKAFYNASGVTPMNDPSSDKSEFAVRRIWSFLQKFLENNMRVLDLGCGAGRFTFAIERLGAISTGIDCANVPLEYAKGLAKKRGSKAKFIEGDIINLPFPDRSFDVVLLVANNIVEYSYEDMEHMAAQVEAVLKPRGYFCITMRDGILSLIDKKKHYDPLKYRENHSIEIPNKGQFSYETSLWTVSFAKYIIGRYLNLTHEEECQEGIFGMAFQRAGKHKGTKKTRTRPKPKR